MTALRLLSSRAKRAGGARSRGICFVAALALLTAATPSVSDAPVADAAQKGDVATLRRLIQTGADVNAAQGDGMTALHWAAMRGDAAQVALLVGAKAKIDPTTRNGSYTPLHLASRAGNAAAIAALARAGANVAARTTAGGATPLHFAAGHGDRSAVVALLDAKAPVDARDSAYAQTPLMWAAAADRVDAVKVLLARGADIKATSKVENVAELAAAQRVATQAKRRAAGIGAAPAGGGGGRGGRAAGAPGAAARAGGTGAARGGAAAGADSIGRRTATDSITRRQADTLTRRPAATTDTARAVGDSLRRAAPADSQQGQGRIGRGADLYGNKGGLTPLLFAVREGHTQSVMALLAAGADVNQVSAGDHTSPLLMATINGQFDLAKVLLERGANPKLASDANATPLYATINLQWAAKSLYPQPTAHKQQQTTYLELMELLLEKGADPNVRLSKHLWYMSFNFDLLGVNTTGATPFWRAAYGTDVPAMRLLKKYGADHTIPTMKAGGAVSADAPVESDTSRADPSGLPPIPNGGPGVYPIHAASGVGYGEGYAANAHMHAPDGWLPAVKYLIEELKVDVNARDLNGFNPIHHAAARGDNQLIEYLVSKGGDVMAISRRGQTTVDMANGPVQRITPFPETIKLLEKLGAKNSNKCRSC
jgi:ankyrin repeat protein